MALYGVNNAIIKVARESSDPGVLPAAADRDFVYIPRTQIDNWAPNVIKIEDDSQRDDRQMEKGATAGIDATPGWTSNMTVSLMKYLLPYMMFTEGNRKPEDITFRIGGFTGGATDEIDVEALTAAQVGYLSAGTILDIRGAKEDLNNGLFTVETTPSVGDTEIAVAQNFTDEAVDITAGVDEEFIYATVAGFRFPQAQTIVCLWNSVTEELTITSANHGLDTIGLIEGQMIEVGHRDTSGVIPTYTNSFIRTVSGQDIAVAGTGIIKEITSGTIVLEEVSADLRFDGNSTNTAIDIMFGSTFDIKKTFDPDFVKPTMFGELEYIDDAGDRFVSLAKGITVNTVSINMPVREKITVGVETIGRDVVDVVNTMRVTRDDSDPANVINPTVHATRNLPDHQLMNSTAHLQRLNLRVRNAAQKVSPYYEAGTITITNNVSGLPVLAQNTIADAPHGNFGANLSISAFLQGTNPGQQITSASRLNIDVSFDVLFANNEGGVGLFFPSMDPGDSQKGFVTGQRVTISVNQSGHKSNKHGQTCIISTFNHPMPPIPQID